MGREVGGDQSGVNKTLGEHQEVTGGNADVPGQQQCSFIGLDPSLKEQPVSGVPFSKHTAGLYTMNKLPKIVIIECGRRENLSTHLLIQFLPSCDPGSGGAENRAWISLG